MSWYRTLKRWKKGDTINAEPLNQIARAASWACRPRIASPLSGFVIAGGLVIGPQPTDDQLGQLAITSTSISAAVLTSSAGIYTLAPGGGSAYNMNWNGTNYVMDNTGGSVDTSLEYPVLNFSTTTSGIPAWTIIWIEEDENGNWLITAVDCAN
jgi:hypothetical protein